MKRLVATIGTAALAVTAQEARADIAPLDAHADDVTLDAQKREVDLRGNVRVDSPPFHLTSNALKLRRGPRGVEVEGSGRLAFCPCLGTPLAVPFEGAIVAPPGDLVLKRPRLEIYGVPVMWLPYFWLRSPARTGLLPPDLAYRGADGLFVGDGVHVPWRYGDMTNGLDVRAGAYLRGGVGLGGTLRTPSSTTEVRWDHLAPNSASRGPSPADGLTVDARGAAVTDVPAITTAWDIDAIRGERGVLATTDLDAAARVYDRAAADVAYRDGALTVASGVRTTSLRGGDLYGFGASGPVASVRGAESIGEVGAWDVALHGGALHDELTALSLAYARAEAGAKIGGRFGALGAEVSSRAAGDLVDGGLAAEGAAGRDGAVSARASLGLPLARAYESDDPGDPWRHLVEPQIAASALVARGDDHLGVRPVRGLAEVAGGAWSAEAGASTAFGQWGSGETFEASATTGVVGTDTVPNAAARFRAAATAAWLGLSAEGAHVLRLAARGPGISGTGSVVATRARVGPARGLHLGLHAAGRSGVDPVLARLLTDAPLEPSQGLLSATGWGGGATAVVPWVHALATRAGVDADLTARVLLSARAGIELRDRCECIALRLSGAHRLGRDGVDVWVTLDLAPSGVR